MSFHENLQYNHVSSIKSINDSKNGNIGAFNFSFYSGFWMNEGYISFFLIFSLKFILLLLFLFYLIIIN